MGILEITTTNTDSKVDAILNKLDSWDIPTKRRGVTTNNSTDTRRIPRAETKQEDDLYPHRENKTT